MKLLPEINVHGHIFDEKDSPDGFPNKIVRSVLSSKVGFAAFSQVSSNIVPFTENDALDRLKSFIKQGREGQYKTYLRWRSHWDFDTYLVVLTMDMSNMGCGKVRDYGIQLKEVEHIRLNDEYCLPFLMLDHRNPKMMEYFNTYIVNGKWSGVKFYHPLGTFPYDKEYAEAFEYLNSKSMPVITHCTYSNPIHYYGKESVLEQLLGDKYDKRDNRKTNCNKFTDPLNYEPILQRYQHVKVDFAHGGGSKVWEEYGDDPTNPNNLLYKILDLCIRYENAYFDCSFALNKRNVSVLRMIMQHSILRTKALFGSDYYMNMTECSEDRYSIDIFKELGQHDYYQIAHINNNKFIFG